MVSVLECLNLAFLKLSFVGGREFAHRNAGLSMLMAALSMLMAAHSVA